MTRGVLESQLLNFLAEHQRDNGEAPASIRDFCEQSGYQFEAVRAVIISLFGQDMVGTFIGHEYAWLTPQGLAHFHSEDPSVVDAQAKMLVDQLAQGLALWDTGQANAWVATLREMARHDGAMSLLQGLLKG